jgi:acyl-coenzyme A synthetase/AMP-(fatty) acid ligase
VWELSLLRESFGSHARLRNAILQSAYEASSCSRPQCSASAVSHLVGTTHSSHLLYHPKYRDLAESSRNESSPCSILELPSIVSLDSTTFDPSWPPEPSHPDDTSHVFHTSGTSGTPKPIPHFHRAEVLALPRRPIGHHDTLTSSFTTTPLFHGGVSDLLRAWMAKSTLYLYPSSTSAITSQSIVSSVRACQPTPDSQEHPITSFLSVPYILTLLSPASDPSDKTGATKLLASMEIVSTGGAPLDKNVGDGLVERGVNLVSRLGSSECGCEY